MLFLSYRGYFKDNNFNEHMLLLHKYICIFVYDHIVVKYVVDIFLAHQIEYSTFFICFSEANILLAHLSLRLIGELIGYS